MSLPPMTASLVVEGPSGRKSFPVKQPRTRIGRGEENDIVLDDAFVSRYHAIISRDREGFWIEDISSGGLLVDGRPISTQTLLESGSSLRIGELSFSFVVTENAHSVANSA